MPRIYALLGMVSRGIALIGIAISFIPLLGYLLALFVFGPAAVIVGIVPLLKEYNDHAAWGVVLGVILIVFWLVMGKEIYRGWT